MRAIRPGIPHQIFMTDAVFKAAREECAKWLELGLECGGSLLGVFGERGLLLLYAVLTGPAAKQAHGGVTTDAGYQNRAIDTLRRSYPGLSLEYAGDFHLHPFDMAGLSGTDTSTIAAILANPLHENLPFLCAQLWFVVQKEAFGLKTFVATRGRPGCRVDIQEAPIEVVPSDHHLVRTALKGQIYRPSTEVLAMMHAEQIQWPDSAGHRCLKTLNALLETLDERIQLDEEELALIGWKTGGKELNDGLRVLHGTFGGFQCSLIFPPEYPLNGPVLMYRTSEQEKFREYAFCLPWNSLTSPGDVLEQFQKEHSHDQQPVYDPEGSRQPDSPDNSRNHPEQTRRSIATA